MATRKKLSSETAPVEKSVDSGARAAKPAATGAKKATGAVKSTRTKSAAPAPAKASAATHKAPARKAVLASAVAEPESSPVFDVEAYRAEIEVEAYHHWLRRGAPHGSDQHDWLAAIEIVRARVSE